MQLELIGQFGEFAGVLKRLLVLDFENFVALEPSVGEAYFVRRLRRREMASRRRLLRRECERDGKNGHIPKMHGFFSSYRGRTVTLAAAPWSIIRECRTSTNTRPETSVGWNCPPPTRVPLRVSTAQFAVGLRMIFPWDRTTSTPCFRWMGGRLAQLARCAPKRGPKECLRTGTCIFACRAPMTR